MQYLIVVRNNIIVYHNTTLPFFLFLAKVALQRVHATEVARCFTVNINCTYGACTIYSARRKSYEIQELNS